MENCLIELSGCHGAMEEKQLERAAFSLSFCRAVRLGQRFHVIIHGKKRLVAN